VEEILLPRLSDTMTEGVVVRWLRQSGDVVHAGEPIVEVETEKATIDVEAPSEGVLEIVVGAGTVAVGTLLARVAPPGAPRAPEAEKPASTEHAVAARADVPRQPVVTSPLATVRASPAARALAARARLDLETLGSGSGPAGRLVKEDVERALAATAGETTVVPLTAGQRVMARRLAQSNQEIPHFYLDVSVDADALLDLREELRLLRATSPPTITAFVVTASARTLLRHPRVNASWQGEQIVLHAHANVGVAVAVDDELVVPVIQHADESSIDEIDHRIRDLADRARTGTLRLPDVSDATFTVTNLGALGPQSFHAVINPPEAGILAVGAVKQLPVVRDARVTIGHEMRLSLSADHRVYTGAAGARFLADLRSQLENPRSLVTPA